jgi:hypothetical protein
MESHSVGFALFVLEITRATENGNRYGLLDEQQRRLFAGLESIRLDHGGDTRLGGTVGAGFSARVN